MASHDTEAASNDTQSESAQTDPSNKYTQRSRASSPITSSSYHNVPVYPRRFHGATASETSHDPNQSSVDVELKIEFAHILKKARLQPQRVQELFWEQVRAALASQDEARQPVLLDVPLGLHGVEEEPSAQEQQARVEEFVKDQLLLTLPKLFDDYSEKVGDWELARDNYTRYTRYLQQSYQQSYQQSKKRHSKNVHFQEETQVGEGFDEETSVLTVADLQHAKSLENIMRDIYQEVRDMEQKCVEAHILDPVRSRKEDFIIWCILDTHLNMERWAVSFLTAEVGDLDQPQLFSGDDMDSLNIDPDQDPDLEPPELPHPSSSLSRKRYNQAKLGFEKANFIQDDPSHVPPSPTLNESEIVGGTHPRHVPKPPVGLPFAQNRATPSTLMAQHVLRLIKPPLDPAACQVIYDVSWELPAFFTSHYPAGSKLGSLLTVTGSNEDAHATTCEAYLFRWWGPLGLLLLHSIEDVLLSSRSGFATTGQTTIGISQNEEVRQKLESLSLQTESDSLPHASELYVSTATISIQGDLDNQTSLASAIMWLCSAIRFPHQGLDLSEALIAPNSNEIYSAWPKLRISLKPLQATNRGTTQDLCCCWHKLFDLQVIASGFRIPERKVGHGLEISYQDMLLLARSKGLAKVHGGLLPEGFSTLLIPVEQIEEVEGLAIQWHLEMKQRDPSHPNDFQVLTAEMLDEIWPHSWLRTADEISYVNQRAFLGWTTKAVVIAGTTDKANLNVQTSGYDKIDDAERKSAKGFSVTVGMSPLTVAPNYSTTLSRVTSSMVSLDMKDTHWALKRASKDHSVIYDTDAETGWLLPQSCIILLICHIILYIRKEKVLHNAHSAFPEPLFTRDAGDAAFEAIITSLSWTTPREKGIPSRLSKPEKFLSLVEDILFMSRKATKLLRDSQSDRAQCGKGAPQYIIGVELLDVALSQFDLQVKEAEISQSWAHMTTKQWPLVFFCRNLGQPIISSLSEPMCNDWRMVPGKRNYLVAMGHSVLHALESNSGYRLGANIRWKLRDETSLFTKHTADTILKDCNHVQYLKEDRSSAPSDIKVVKMVQPWEAYIFGSSRRLAKRSRQHSISQKKTFSVSSFLSIPSTNKSQNIKSDPFAPTSHTSSRDHNRATSRIAESLLSIGFAPESSMSTATSVRSLRVPASSRGSITTPDLQDSDEAGVDEDNSEEEEGNEEGIHGNDEEYALEWLGQPEEPFERPTHALVSPKLTFIRTPSGAENRFRNTSSDARPTVHKSSVPKIVNRPPTLRHKKGRIGGFSGFGESSGEVILANSVTAHSSEPRMNDGSEGISDHMGNSCLTHNRKTTSTEDFDGDDDERQESEGWKDKGKQKEETVGSPISPFSFVQPTQRDNSDLTRGFHGEDPGKSILPSKNNPPRKHRGRSLSTSRHSARSEKDGESSRGEIENQHRDRKNGGHQRRQSGKGKQDK